MDGVGICAEVVIVCLRRRFGVAATDSAGIALRVCQDHVCSCPSTTTIVMEYHDSSLRPKHDYKSLGYEYRRGQPTKTAFQSL
jgi:hypothetical protein